MDFNAHFSPLPTCRYPPILNIPQGAITLDYRHQPRARAGFP
jgi:hypothetical protein